MVPVIQCYCDVSREVHTCGVVNDEWTPQAVNLGVAV